MNREVHVRVWERAEVKFLRATRHLQALLRRNIGGRFVSVKRHYSRSLRLCVRNVCGSSLTARTHRMAAVGRRRP